MKAIRCGSNNLFGRQLDNGLIEFKCRSKFCKDHEGEIVFHRFDPATWELVETIKYKDPAGAESAAEERKNQ